MQLCTEERCQFTNVWSNKHTYYFNLSQILLKLFDLAHAVNGEVFFEGEAILSEEMIEWVSSIQDTKQMRPIILHKVSNQLDKYMIIVMSVE